MASSNNRTKLRPCDEGMYTSEGLKNLTLNDGTHIVTSPVTDIKRPVCAGIDVHKSVLMAAICVTDKETLNAVFYVRQFTDLAEVPDTVKYGMITSVVDTPVVDAQYRILHTDILGIEQASGVLIDLEGRVVGIIAQNFQAEIGQITMSALAPADIQILVGNLANNREWSYLGITGKDIDSTISQEFDMPRGIYVRSVASESPAMYAGIYEADIITKINGDKIRNIEDYEKEIRGHSPDEVIRVGIKRATMEGYVDMELSVQLGHG